MGSRWLLFLIILGSVCCVSARAADQTPIYAEGPKSSTYLGSYKPKLITRLGDLPAAVQLKLTAHLIERLGAEYFGRLTVSDGQIVDREELYRAHPAARNYKLTVFAYRIGFRISDPDKGIKQFNGYIRLNSDGSVLREIEFPAVARMPWKGHFVSLAWAVEKARTLGLSVARAEMAYLPEEDVLAFVLRERFPQHGDSSGWVRTLRINAHTGDVIRDDRYHYQR